MCQTARNVATGEEISGMGDIRRIAPLIFWADDPMPDLPDNSCLCHVDLPNTLTFAGYKVWRGPNMSPEFLFEPVEERV